MLRQFSLWRLVCALLTTTFVIFAAPVTAQEVSDREVEQRLTDIFEQIEALEDVTVSVDAGVVTLSGAAAADDAIDQAQSITEKMDGVVTVQNEIVRSLDVDTNVRPVLQDLLADGERLISAAPLLVVAVLFAILIGFIGHLIARMSGLWRWIAPNQFLAELLATTVRIVFIAAGIFIALDILDATALIGAILGSVGVIGLAVGFAMRDTVENYISSIMLSLRQPFRGGDFVKIGESEGFVVRLTSRATILITPGGNHLRLPNSSVFKANILNYSRNPERRFSFELGIDADDDPAAAIETGKGTLEGLDFVLKDPHPNAYIETVGDSNIVIAFTGWIDQRETDFLRARSVAIREVKTVLEDSGFAIPEPIYRLRLDERGLDGLATALKPQDRDADSAPAKPKAPKKPKKAAAPMDTKPDEDIKKLVDEERADAQTSGDLLNEDQPME